MGPITMAGEKETLPPRLAPALSAAMVVASLAKTITVARLIAHHPAPMNVHLEPESATVAATGPVVITTPIAALTGLLLLLANMAALVATATIHQNQRLVFGPILTRLPRGRVRPCLGPVRQTTGR